MHSQIISLLALASVSLGAIVQAPLGDIQRQEEAFARIHPPVIPVNELREACTTLRSNLTQEEIDVCDYVSNEDRFNPGGSRGLRRHGLPLDFVSHICGYKVESESIPYTFSSVPRLGPGVLYDRFAVDTFKVLFFTGKWQQVRRTLYCLKEQNNITKHTEDLSIHFHPDDSSQDAINEIIPLLLDTISTFDNLKGLDLDLNGMLRSRGVSPTITSPGIFPSVPATSGTRRPISVHHLGLTPHTETIVHHLHELQSIHMAYGPWDRPTFHSLLNGITGKNITSAFICLPELVLDDEWQLLSKALNPVYDLTLHPNLDLYNMSYSIDIDLVGAIPFLQTLNDLQNLTVKVASRNPKDEPNGHYFLNPPPNSIEYGNKVYAVLCYNLPKLVRLEYIEGWTSWRHENCDGWRQKCVAAGEIGICDVQSLVSLQNVTID